MFLKKRFFFFLNIDSIDRYYKALQSNEFHDIDSNLRREAFEWFHQFRNMYVACDSWYEASCRDYIEYWDCSGDLLLDWKDRGYATVFDLLQVSLIIQSNRFQAS